LSEQHGHKGVKLARFSLLPPEFLWGLAEIYGKGAEKYAERNWERGYPDKYGNGASVDALLRHIVLWMAGKDIDQESGQLHLLHAAFRLAALYTFQVRGIGRDTRTAGCGSLTSELLNPEDIEAARAEAGANFGQRGSGGCV